MNYFISITKLETLIDTHLPENPIYAEISHRVNTFSREIFITVSDVQHSTGRYWAYYCGQAQNLDEQQIREMTFKAQNYIKQITSFMEGRGLNVIQGIMTLPNDLEMLEGVTDLINIPEKTH